MAFPPSLHGRVAHVVEVSSQLLLGCAHLDKQHPQRVCECVNSFARTDLGANNRLAKVAREVFCLLDFFWRLLIHCCSLVRKLKRSGEPLPTCERSRRFQFRFGLALVRRPPYLLHFICNANNESVALPVRDKTLLPAESMTGKMAQLSGKTMVSLRRRAMIYD